MQTGEKVVDSREGRRYVNTRLAYTQVDRGSRSGDSVKELLTCVLSLLHVTTPNKHLALFGHISPCPRHVQSLQLSQLKS